MNGINKIYKLPTTTAIVHWGEIIAETVMQNVTEFNDKWKNKNQNQLKQSDF